MLSRTDDYSHLADDDPAAPWNVDPNYGGPPDRSAMRRSWEAAQQRTALRIVHDDPPAREDVPPVESAAEFGLPDDAEPDVSMPLGVQEAAPVLFKSPCDWPEDRPAPTSWLVHNRIPHGDVTGLVGDGGSGKTDIGLQLACSCARGRSEWLGAVVEPGPAIFLSAEEPEDAIRWRMHRLGERDGFDPRTVNDLQFWFPDDLKECSLAVRDKSGMILGTALFESIQRKIEAVAPRLVILDNIAAVFAGNQIERVHARMFVNLWRAVARGPSRPAVVLTDHPSLSGIQAGTGRGGSMDWRNSMRSVLYLRPAEDKAEADAGIRVLEVVKSNYGPIGEKVRLRWSNGGMALESSLSPIQQAAREQDAEAKFLDMLSRHLKLGIDLSPSAGRSYAPSAFAEAPDAEGYTKRALAGAMHRLLETGRIAVEQFGPPSRRTKRLTIP